MLTPHYWPSYQQAPGASFELCCSHGQLARSERLAEGSFDHFINVANLAPGVYIYRVTLGKDTKFTGKLVVH
jgi:hypothetical protein